MRNISFPVGLALTALLCGCAGSAGTEAARRDVAAAEVRVYEVVPADSVRLALPDSVSADYASLLPLRMKYRVADTAKVNSLIGFNKEYFGEKGHTARWVTYSYNDMHGLVVLPSAPVLRDSVNVTAIDTISDEGRLMVAFRFSDSEKWERITSDNIGRRLAIVLGDRVMSAPQVNCPITGGNCSVLVTPGEFSEYFN